MDLLACIRDIPDFPKEGILFKDITPLLSDPAAFREAIDQLAAAAETMKPQKIVAAEARGFLFGSALAYKLGIGLVPVRKPGKLPYKNISVSYDLEYGSDTLCMHEDAVEKGEAVLILDDVLATGGTAAGMAELVEKAGGTVAGLLFLMELDFLKGRDKLGGRNTVSLLHVTGD